MLIKFEFTFNISYPWCSILSNSTKTSFMDEVIHGTNRYIKIGRNALMTVSNQGRYGQKQEISREGKTW